MMKRKRRASEEKLEVVMAGIKGRRVADICAEYGINQTQYYQWRDTFLSNAAGVFEDKRKGSQEEEKDNENKHLEELVADLSQLTN